MKTLLVCVIGLLVVIYLWLQMPRSPVATRESRDVAATHEPAAATPAPPPTRKVEPRYHLDLALGDISSEGTFDLANSEDQTSMDLRLKGYGSPRSHLIDAPGPGYRQQVREAILRLEETK